MRFQVCVVFRTWKGVAPIEGSVEGYLTFRCAIIITPWTVTWSLSGECCFRCDRWADCAIREYWLHTCRVTEMVQSVVLWSSKWVVQGDEKGQKCRRRAPTGGVGNEKGQKRCRRASKWVSERQKRSKVLPWRCCGDAWWVNDERNVNIYES